MKPKNKSTPEGPATPPRPIVVRVTTPASLTTALEGINEKVGDLIATQQEKWVAQEKDKARANTTPMKVEIINQQKNSALWGIMVLLSLVSLVVILALFGIWNTLSTITAPPSQTSKITTNTTTDIYATKNEISALKETSASNVTSLKNEVAKLEKKFERKVDLLKDEVKKQVIDEIKKIVPQSPVKKTVTVPAPIWRVNILLIDEYGRVPECFKGVRVSDITQKGKHTHFLFEGKPIDWNQKVVFSYSYKDNDPPITGTIYYTPEIAGAASKVINVPPCNVYQDSDGTIRYDDLNGGFPRAPKGAGYITAQSTLPTQP